MVLLFGPFASEPNKHSPVASIIAVAAYLKVEAIRKIECAELCFGDGPDISSHHGLHYAPILEGVKSISGPR